MIGYEVVLADFYLLVSGLYTVINAMLDASYKTYEMRATHQIRRDQNLNLGASSQAPARSINMQPTRHESCAGCIHTIICFVFFFHSEIANCLGADLFIGAMNPAKMHPSGANELMLF
jgi:hypothetical protein